MVKAFSHTVCVNFGRILYGNVGSSERLDFTIIGDAVNIAARGVIAAKSLGADYVFTRQFVDYFGGDQLTSLGSSVFKGTYESVELFGLSLDEHKDPPF